MFLRYRYNEASDHNYCILQLRPSCSNRRIGLASWMVCLANAIVAGVRGEFVTNSRRLQH